jgi:tetratricopeptide (TPR) repeat protein
MNREDKIISVAIVSIWVFILLFSFLTLIKPSWLEQAASDGVKVEAATKKRAGDLYLDKKEYARAIALYADALQLDSTMKGAEANKAVAFYNMGNYPQAIKVYTKLLKEKPDYPDLVYYNMAEIYSKTGNKKAGRPSKKATRETVKKSKVSAKRKTKT